MRAARYIFPCLILAGCWSDAGDQGRPIAKAPEPVKPLYERLGGEKKIEQIVNEWVDRTLADPQVNFTRKGTESHWVPADSNVAHVKMRLVEFICAASGGPQKYQGRDMKSVHQGMQISGGELDAMIKDLKETLIELQVGENERNDLFKMMESVRKEIVEVP